MIKARKIKLSGRICIQENQDVWDLKNVRIVLNEHGNAVHFSSNPISASMASSEKSDLKYRRGTEQVETVPHSDW